MNEAVGLIHKQPGAGFGLRPWYLGSLHEELSVLFFRKKEPKTSSRQKLALAFVQLIGFLVCFLAFSRFTFLFLDFDDS